MALPTAQEVTNAYLYDSINKPGLLSYDLIRDPGVTTTPVEVHVSEFMTLGGGRFAIGSSFEIVDRFFSEQLISNITPNDGSYVPGQRYEMSKATFGGDVLGLGYYGLDIAQKDFADGTDDYAERTYIFNNGRFKLGDDALFVIEADGTRKIEDFSIVPERNDNFDFTSSGLSQIGNLLLEPKIDPSGIGRQVTLEFTNYESISTFDYVEADFLADQATAANWTKPRVR